MLAFEFKGGTSQITNHLRSLENGGRYPLEINDLNLIGVLVDMAYYDSTLPMGLMATSLGFTLKELAYRLSRLKHYNLIEYEVVSNDVASVAV